ncbi:class II aldolase/adducin family protein [Microbacteriaceae bacterium VKM Ac-2854]|nr:class II aldolase/adducin family protein [Microbacteriaceae bacterium VKM Ac-2854]
MTDLDLDLARANIRSDIASTLRILGARGFQYGLAGHATVRDPGAEERYWVNPAGVPFELTDAADIVLVDGDGRVVEGRHEAHGYQSQVEVHRARPDLLAGLHVHSLHTFAWSSRGGLLYPLTTDSAWLDGLQAFRTGFDQPVTEALGAEARILIQRSHGAVTFGASIAEAGFYFLSVERAAQTQLLLEAAGRADRVEPETLSAWRLSPEGAAGQFRALIEADSRAWERRDAAAYA